MPIRPELQQLIDTTLSEDRSLAADYLQQSQTFSKKLAEMGPVDETNADAYSQELRRQGYATRWTGKALVLDPGERRAAFPALASTIRAKTTDPETLKYLDEAQQKVAAEIDGQTSYLVGNDKIGRRMVSDREAMQHFWGTTSADTQWQQDQQAAKQEGQAAQAKQTLQGVEDTLGTGATRDAAVGAIQGATDVASLFYRVADLAPGDKFTGKADEANRATGALEQAAREGDVAADRHDSLGGWIRSAGRSAVPMILGGFGVGSIGLKGTAALLASNGVGGAVAANQAFTEGRDAGLDGARLYGYVATVGAAETVLSTLLSKGLGKVLGSEGTEKLFIPGAAGNAFGKGLMGAAKEVGLDLLSEVTEENLVEISQAVAAKAFGADKTAWTADQFWNLVADTTMSTLLLAGGAHTAHLGIELAGHKAPAQDAQTNAAIAQELNRSPEREGKIADLAARTGMSPEMLRNLPDHLLTTDIQDAQAVASQVPGLQKFLAGGPDNVTVSKGDHLTLAQIAELAANPTHRQEDVRGDAAGEAVSFMQDQLKINQLVHESQTGQRSKAKMAEALDAFGLNKVVKVDATIAQELMQDGNLSSGLQAVGISQEQVNDAAGKGQDVNVNLQALHTALTPEQFKAVAKVLKRNEGAASVGEVENLDRAAETGRAQETLAEYSKREEAARTEVSRLAQELQGIDIGGQKASPEQITTTLQKMDAFDRRMAARGGERGAYLRQVSFKNAQVVEPGKPSNQPVDIDAAAKALEQELASPAAAQVNDVTDAELAPLPGLPASSPGPIASIVSAAKRYAAQAGLSYRRQSSYVKADPERGARIAKAFEEMKHDPENPEVKAAYAQMIKETLAQYEVVKQLGLKIEVIKDGMADPYPEGPKQVLDDLRNGHLWLFPTSSGFGTLTDIKDNPLLAPTGEEIDGHKLVANDIFRIVHDVFGHGKEGVGFGPSGEENTWQAHVRMYSPLAARAMTTETRGQNSWVNFGPHGEKNRANQKETIYADQKIGLLPEWVMTEGVTDEPTAVTTLNQIKPGQEPQGFQTVARNLTPEEKQKLRTDTAQKLVDMFKDLPADADFAEAAKAGAAKKGWYEKSTQAIRAIFGDVDAPRFAALLAATSPQCSVETNLLNATNIWKNWVAAGRPTEREAVIDIMGQSVQGGKGRDSVLDAWINNTVRALSAEQGAPIMLSGPKVNSFMLNLSGNVQEVTNDAWMANFALVDQAIFGGSMNVKGTDPGKGPGYLAMAAKVRRVADKLTKETGTTWTPAEVQETVWSWAKTLYEMADAKDEKRTAEELVKQGAITDEAVASTPDFSVLFTKDATVRSILEAAGYGDVIAAFESEFQGSAGRDPGATGEGRQGAAREVTPGLLRSARRLDKLREQRRSADGSVTLDQPKAKKSGAPRTVSEAVAAGKPFKLIHWSNQDNLAETNPKFAGTAGAGQEKAAYSKGAQKRTFFGLLGRYRKEGQIGSNAYEVTVDPAKVYDVYADPNGYMAAAQAKAKDSTKARQLADDMARKDGFTFFYSSKEGPWFPVLYTYDKVEGLRKIEDPAGNGLVMPPMVEPTVAERALYLNQGFNDAPIAAKLTRFGEAFKLVKKLHTTNGWRLSGFTDASRTVFYGYDKNGESFTIRTRFVKPDSIIETTPEAESIKAQLRDIQATPDVFNQGGELPPVKPGFVRMYRGGDATGNMDRWFSTHLPYAEGYAKMNGGSVSWVDVPADHPAIADSVADNRAQNFNAQINAALPPGIAAQARPMPSAAPELPRGQIRISDKGYLIKVFQGADFSTITHELAHSFLAEMQTLVQSGRASREAQKDWQTLMKWMGVKDGKITVEAHEKFARGWEQYELEGKAPAAGLMGAFQRFSHWLKEVYKDAKGYFEGVKLNDDVRRVFDRMLASEEDAARAVFASEQTVRSDQELKKLGLQPDEKKHVNDLLEAGRAKLEDKLTRARNKELRPLLAKWKKEATAEAGKTPVYAAMDAVKALGGFRWSRMKFDFGQDTINQLKKIHGDGIIATKETDGAQPEDVAEQHGFESVEDMLAQMLDAPPRKDFEKALVDQKLRNHDFSFDPMEMVADSPEFAEAAEAMAKYYGRALEQGERVTTTKAIKERAKQLIGEMPMGEATRQDKFIQQVKTHTQRERRAAAKGNFDEALRHNEKARLALQLAAEATRIQELRDAVIQKAKSAIAPPAKGQSLKVAAAHMENIAALMVRYGLGLKNAQINPKKAPLADLFRDVDGAYDMTGQFDERFFNEADAARYQTLSVSEFESLGALIGALDRLGRDLANDFINEGKARLADVVAGSTGWMQQLKDKARWFDGSGTLGKVAETLNKTLIGPLTQMDFIFRAADGFNGPRVKDLDASRPLTQHVVLRSSEAADKAERRFKAMHDLLKPHLATLAEALGRLGRKPKGVPGVPEFVQKALGIKAWTNDQILAMALNMGNAYNRQNLARGFGWDAADEAVMPAELARVGELFSAKEWQAIQGIWDAIGTMKGDLFAAHEKMFGFAPPEVEPTPFSVTTSDGQTITLPGGYFPVRFDSRLSLRQAGQEEAQSIKDMFGAAFAPVAAKRGMTIARKNTGGKPFLLDPARVLREHIEFTTKFITHGQFVRDTNRLFTNKDWAQLFVDKFGRHIYDELNGWLRSQVVAEHQPMTWFDMTVEKFRPLTSLYVLGLRVKGMINQADALASLPADIGVRNYLRGVARMTNPKQLVTDFRFMLDNSTFMRERLVGGRDREMNDLLRDVDLGKFAKVSKAKKIGQRVSLAPIVYPSLALEFVAWNAMFQKAMGEHNGDVAKAISLADISIDSTQPANRAKDLSRLQRDKKGAARLVTTLMSFSIRRWNANNFMRRAILEGQVSASDAVTYGFLTWVVAPILPTLILAALWNDWDDEDKLKKLGVKIAQDLVSYQIQGIPLANDALAAGVKVAQGEKVGSAVSTAADTPARLHAKAVNALANLPEAFSGDDAEPFWALADLVSYYSGIPVVRAYKDLTRGWDQYEAEGNPVNILIPEPKEKK